ncbi:MAG: PAS domain S-box protein [Chloroflexota bacterium]|jgi:PAS domain S-box-containing protein
MHRLRTSFPLRSSVLYCLFSAAWIIGSDLATAALTGNPLQGEQTLKGLLFITATAVLLYVLLHREELRRQHTEQMLRRTSRAYRMLSECNQAIVRAEDESTLLHDLCDRLVTPGGYRLAWVGWAEHDQAHTVRPVAWAGHEADYLATIRVTWADDEHGQGPTGRAIRTGRPQMARFITDDPNFAPWREEALRRGYRSSIALPVDVQDGTSGMLALYSADLDAFDPTEVALLEELAGDLAYGIRALRTREALQQSTDALRETNKQLQAIIQASPLAILSLTLDGRVLTWNQAGERIFGWAEAEVVGHPLPIVPPDKQDEFRALRARVEGGEGFTELEATRQRKDGTPIDISISTAPIYDEDGAVARIMAVVADISARKQAELAEREQRALVEALTDAVVAINSTLDIDQILDRILANVGRVIPHDFANIMLVTDGVAHVVGHRGYDKRGAADWADKQRFAVSETARLRTMAETGEPLVIADTASLDIWDDSPGEPQRRSWAGAPICLIGEVIGFLNVASATPNFFNEKHAQALKAFADRAATALHNARLYEEIRSYAGMLETRVEQRTAELNESKEHLETILNSTSDVILLTDMEGIIQRVNPAFASFFPHDLTEVVGWPLAELITPEQAAVLAEGLRTAISSRQSARVELIASEAGGASLDAEVSLSPIENRSGTITGIVYSIHDISAHKRLEAQLRQTLNQQVELNELKSRFVAMAAHDLRNPLSVIQTAIELLRRYHERMTDAQRQERYERIQASIKFMIALLDDILLIGKAESRTLAPNLQPIDLPGLCREIVTEIEQTSAAEHKVVSEFEAQSQDAVTDPKLLRHILSNLLDNAAKYSPAGSTITFGVIYTAGHATFTVRDEGIGIAQADLDRLFEPFFRADNVVSTPGTGLGLAIVKQMVDQLGGTIEVSSVLGAGTTFVVTLPLTTPGGVT